MRRAHVGLMLAVASFVAVIASSAASTANTKLEATLNGKAEGAPKTNKGKAEVTLNAKTGKVCWDFNLAKIDGKPTQAHIHKGKAGVAGNVVVPFGATTSARVARPRPRRWSSRSPVTRGRTT